MDDSEPIEETIDSILEMLPISYYHHRLLFICGLSFMADSMEVALLSFMSACAGDEFNLSDSDRASLVGVVFVGELVGSLFWGPIADKFGRKIAFLLAAGVISLCGFLSAFSPTFTWLIILRGLVGFGVGGGSVPFDLLAEFLPESHRGTYLMSIEYAWTFGSLFVVGIAWAIIGSYGWRLLTLITAIPVTVASIACWIFLPESPRWLMIKNRKIEAESVLRSAAVACGVDLRHFSLVKELTSPSVNTFSSISQSLTHSNYHANLSHDDQLDNNLITPTAVKEYTYIDLLTDKHARKISIPLWTIWFVFGVTYYGIVLFVNRLYTIQDPTEVLGVFIATVVVDRWGRIRTQQVFFILAGAAVVLMGVPLPSVMLVLVAVVGRMSIMGACSATWVATPELYPTPIRATGHSLCVTFSRLGGFISPYFVISSLSDFEVGLGLGGLNLLASFASCWLPETAGLSLEGRALSSSQDDDENDALKANSVESQAQANDRAQCSLEHQTTFRSLSLSLNDSLGSAKSLDRPLITECQKSKTESELLLTGPETRLLSPTKYLHSRITETEF